MPQPLRAATGSTPAAAPFWRIRVAAVGTTLALALVSGCTAGDSRSDQPSPTPSPTASVGGGAGQPSVPSTGGLEQVPGVAARLEPSVVTVLVDGGQGSGVVYSKDGLILTNEHVVRGNTTTEIAFADGQRVAGRVKATDAVTDLALVQAERQNLPAATFQQQLPTVGSLAVVIGSPLGFEGSVTAGVISGLHREIPGSASQGQSLVDLIQTDAPISPGNSGGAVINAAGEVIGISEAYIPPQTGAVSLGFAIPAATAVDIAHQLNEDGRAEHAFAGLVPAPITEEIAAQLGLGSTDGVIVADVTSGGPAAKAGLQPGDVITAVDGEPTATPEDFLGVLRPHRPGDTLTLTVHRPGQAERKVELTVIDRPVAGSR